MCFNTHLPGISPKTIFYITSHKYKCFTTVYQRICVLTAFWFKEKIIVMLFNVVSIFCTLNIAK